MSLFKKFTEKITITHAYSSNYAISNFASNPNFDFNNFDQFGYSSTVYETNGNFIPQYEESGILISEKFIPFIGVDIKWKGTLSTRLEYKRSRDIFLSFSNNQIRQQSNNGLTIGAGYTIKDLAFNVNVDGQTQNIKSDLNLRLDITTNNTNEIYRKIIEQINIPNTSQKSMDITFTADYSINNSLSIQFYFNDNFMQTNGTPLITNSKGGFKVRYSLR
jgi:cell surface protein SprA